MASRVGPKMKAGMQKLIDERKRLIEQITALHHKLEGIERAITLLGEVDGESLESATDTSKRGQAKTLILDLLREVGAAGLNAASAVDLAARRGIKLERATAASNLSRLKADNVVAYDNDRYRLIEHTRSALVVVAGGAKSP